MALSLSLYIRPSRHGKALGLTLIISPSLHLSLCVCVWRALRSRLSCDGVGQPISRPIGWAPLHWPVGYKIEEDPVFDFEGRRMEQQMKYLIEVEKGREATGGKPSRGPVYRSFFAKNGFPAPVEGMDSCWDIFRWVSCLLRLVPNW